MKTTLTIISALLIGTFFAHCAAAFTTNALIIAAFAAVAAGISAGKIQKCFDA